MMAIDSNNSCFFSLLGLPCKDYGTFRTNRAEPLTTWAVLLIIIASDASSGRQVRART